MLWRCESCRKYNNLLHWEDCAGCGHPKPPPPPEKPKNPSQFGTPED